MIYDEKFMIHKNDSAQQYERISKKVNDDPIPFHINYNSNVLKVFMRTSCCISNDFTVLLRTLFKIPCCKAVFPMSLVFSRKSCAKILVAKLYFQCSYCSHANLVLALSSHSLNPSPFFFCHFLNLPHLVDPSISLLLPPSPPPLPPPPSPLPPSVHANP